MAMILPSLYPPGKPAANLRQNSAGSPVNPGVCRATEQTLRRRPRKVRSTRAGWAGARGRVGSGAADAGDRETSRPGAGLPVTLDCRRLDMEPLDGLKCEASLLGLGAQALEVVAAQSLRNPSVRSCGTHGGNVRRAAGQCVWRPRQSCPEDGAETLTTGEPRTRNTAVSQAQ